METNPIEIKVKGNSINIPSTRIFDKTVIVTGSFVRKAVVRGEDWSEKEDVDNPELFIARLRESGLKADIFAFSRSCPTWSQNITISWSGTTSLQYPSRATWTGGRCGCRKLRERA